MAELLTEMLAVFSFSVAAFATRVIFMGLLACSCMTLKATLVSTWHLDGTNIQAKGLFTTRCYDLFLSTSTGGFNLLKTLTRAIMTG